MTIKRKKRPVRRSKTKPSTELARVADVRHIEVADPDGLLAPVLGELGDLAHTGGIGLAEVKLTKKEEAIVARPVNRDELLIHPKGFCYLPHPVYTRWLNEAFGRTGWACVPAAKPMKVENLIIVPHILYVHRVPVAFAHGGAEYHANNKQQTYDDVLESTTAYALRRCCKRFGMALELWDKAYNRAFLAERCIRVQTDTGPMWRLKTDPPLYGEKAEQRRQQQPRRDEPDALEGHIGSDGNEKEPITKQEARRLVQIWRKAGRADADVKLWLKRRYGYEATASIKRFDYNRIERELSAKGELALPGDGE